MHTRTKYVGNEPYFSSIVNKTWCNSYAIEKAEVPAMLKKAQNHISSYSKQNKKQSKYGTIFVLKLNSPKLKAIQSL